MHRTHEFRLAINKDTQTCMSLTSPPGNFSSRVHNDLDAHRILNFIDKSFSHEERAVIRKENQKTLNEAKCGWKKREVSNDATFVR